MTRKGRAEEVLEATVLTISVREAHEPPEAAELVAEINGFSTELGKTRLFRGYNDDGTQMSFTCKERKKRKSDAARMTNLLKVEVQRDIDKSASLATAVQLAGISEVDYFHDLTAMGGRSAWLFLVARDGRQRTALAFARDPRFELNKKKAIRGAGYILQPGSDEAKFSTNIAIIRRQ